jgi:hypothetical protein
MTRRLPAAAACCRGQERPKGTNGSAPSCLDLPRPPYLYNSPPVVRKQPLHQGIAPPIAIESPGAVSLASSSFQAGPRRTPCLSTADDRLRLTDGPAQRGESRTFVRR